MAGLPLSFDTLPIFFLVAIRAISVMLAAPVFSARPFPPMARIGLGLLLALLLTPTFHGGDTPQLDDWRLPGMVLTEAVVGLVLGFTAQLFYQTLRMAASLVEVQMGLTMSGLIDPLQGISESVLTQFYNVFTVLVFLALNGHHLMLIGLARSFDAMPLGDPGVLALSPERWIAVSAVAFQAAIQISLPVVGALLLTDVALAMLARTAPAMNVMLTAAPAKVAIGLFAISAALPIMVAVFAPQLNGLVRATGSCWDTDVSEERTEQATPKRRHDARKRGEVARSPDLTSAVAALGGLLVLSFYAPTLWAKLGERMQEDLLHLARPDLTQAQAGALVISALLTIASLVAPLVAGLALLGFAAGAGQSGLLFSPNLVAPKFSKLNPLSGVMRVFGKRGLFEIGKTLLKVALIAFIGYSALLGDRDALLGLAAQDLPGAASSLAALGLAAALRMAGAGFVLALVDYAWQRHQHESRMKMTKQEVKEEMKQTDGNPQVKAQMRALRMKMARQRMMQDVPKADVIITNPTHLAVALKYDPATMRAPSVLAMGADLMAQRIKEIGREHDVPLLENKPLAQALFKTAEVGQEIPFDLFHAVAEVLAFVYALKGGR